MHRHHFSLRPLALACALTTVLAALGGADPALAMERSKPGQPHNPNAPTLRVRVQSLEGGLVLYHRGVQVLDLDAPGDYSFARRLASGEAYEVGIAWHQPGQSCTLQGAQGTAGSDDVQVTVHCVQAGVTELHPLRAVELAAGAPTSSFIEASDGSFYATVASGGEYGGGSVIRVDREGQTIRLRDFDGMEQTRGALKLTEAADGCLYGATTSGGAHGQGQLFRLRLDGTGYQVLHAFGGGPKLPAHPSSGLLRSGEWFYGVCEEGGEFGGGVLYRWSAEHGLQVLSNYLGEQALAQLSAERQNEVRELGANISEPHGELAEDGDGGIYLSLRKTDSAVQGRVLRYDPKTRRTALPGGVPAGWTVHGLMSASDGVVYGLCSTPGLPAAVLSLRPGKKPKLHMLMTGGDDPSQVRGTLAEGPDGTLYGVTSDGGADGAGTLFSLSPLERKPRILHAFRATTGVSPGTRPQSGLLVASDGDLYGMTSADGALGGGSVFRMR